jgi:hypothetical protein
VQDDSEASFNSFYFRQPITLSNRGSSLANRLGPMLSVTNPFGLNRDSAKVLNGLAEGFQYKAKFSVSLNEQGYLEIEKI